MRPLLLALVFLAGCSTDTAPTDAPSADAATESSDAALEADDPRRLAGTWTHVATASTPDGAREPMGDLADISWTFRADGSGTYSQQVDVMGPDPVTDDFEWTFEDGTIALEGASYTVVARNGDEMTWRNNLLGDYYIVRRQ